MVPIAICGASPRSMKTMMPNGGWINAAVGEFAENDIERLISDLYLPRVKSESRLPPARSLPTVLEYITLGLTVFSALRASGCGIEQRSFDLSFGSGIEGAADLPWFEVNEWDRR